MYSVAYNQLKLCRREHIIPILSLYPLLLLLILTSLIRETENDNGTLTVMSLKISWVTNLFYNKV